jgi:5-methyltetrahydrofolate--homocysteine methyltransferase
MKSFLEKLNTSQILLGDGALGTELQKRGMPVGVCPEEYNILYPDIIRNIHKDYFEAGSDLVETNTFGANRIRLKFFDFENRVEEFNKAAVNIAKEVSGDQKYVAGSIGPIGELIEPLGTISESEAYDAFAEQAVSLEKAGADLLIIETMLALEEIILAVKAVKENTSLPVVSTMSFELGNSGLRTPWGVTIKNAIDCLTELNVDVIGANCGKGFDEMIMIIREMKTFTDKPLIAQANAGIPEWIEGFSVYKETPEIIAPKAEELIKAGVKILGGCCGTNPSHIKIMREIVNKYTLKF